MILIHYLIIKLFYTNIPPYIQVHKKIRQYHQIHSKREQLNKMLFPQDDSSFVINKRLKTTWYDTVL